MELEKLTKTMWVAAFYMTFIEFSGFIAVRLAAPQIIFTFTLTFALGTFMSTTPVLQTFWKHLKFNAGFFPWGVALLVVVLIALFVSIGAHASTTAFLILLALVAARNWLLSKTLISMLRRT